MTESIKQYVLNQRQPIDQYWLCDFKCNEVTYGLLFDNDFNLMDVYTYKMVVNIGNPVSYNKANSIKSWLLMLFRKELIMILNEVKRNLFDIPDKYYLAHCISADYALGAGIAVEFQKRFHLKQNLKSIGKGVYPDCIQIGNVFNLVTKSKYWNKPTYQSIESAIKDMKNICVNHNIKYLAMPKIGCGLDRLQWGKVREIIESTFSDIDIEILVCSL